MRIISAVLLFGLSALAVTPAIAGSKVYVPTGGADQILVIDTEKDEIVATISGTEAAHGLAGDPTRGLLIVGSYAELDAGALGVPDRPEGMKDDEHLAHHDKKSSASTSSDGSNSIVTVIRADDLKIMRRITVSGVVHHVEVTPNGQKAIVTHPDTNKVSVIDLSSFQVTRTIPTGDTPNYAVAASDNTTVFVSNAGSNTVSEIDISTGLTRRQFVVGESPEHMVLSRDGSFLYVANADEGSVSVFSTENGGMTQTYSIGGGIHGLDLSDDGRQLFVAGRENDKVVAINLSTGNQRSGSISPQPYHLKAIPGTSRLYVSSAGEDKIWVVDQNSLKAIKDISVPERAHQMTIF